MTDEVPESDETEDQQRRRLHDAARAELLDRQRSNSESYDKAILTLASGALGLSLSFIKDMLPASVPARLCLLYASWILLTAAIVTTVGSFLLSNEAINQALRQNTEYYLKKIEAAFTEKKTKLARAVDVSNYAAGTLFVLGIILTVTFVSVNFYEVRSMKTSNTEPIDLKSGHSGPQMQKVAAGGLEKGQPIPHMQQVTKPTQPSEATAQQSAADVSTVPAAVTPAIPASPSTPKK